MVTSSKKLTPPATIVAAFFGFLVSTVSALASAGFLLGARQELATALRASDLRMTEEQVEQATTVAQAIAIGVALVIALFYLWLSFKLKAGRNWARVVLTVVTLLQVASLFTTQGETMWGYLSCAVAVVALVLSYLPASNEYITAVKHTR
ncbi:hypothetical protein KIPE111705_39175 [Kibdelosporangium persicum]|uniref:DUF2127 domain-containing protein n=1 Tax=Kibdelosporangium persicum TaxID=2698649 RepID=A0ABX2FGY9_9PSEU|nr:hypothetical protein [Kibdelosporangium persicum]NRN70033.1 hypothetical protein [Kibdelosporangium persicum]